MFLAEQGGYTTVTVTVSLLLTLTLTFSLATGMWIQNRAADAQTVADSAALAGANVVGSYVTLAKITDAAVLTMGLAGIVVLGAGLVASAVPGLSSAGASTVDAALKILDSRQKFATSAVESLEKLEATLPLAIAARSAAVVSENSTSQASYIGCALAYPATSKTDFSTMDAQIDTAEIEETAAKIQEASDEVKRLEDEVEAAKYAGWLADCGNEPRCMYERAESLAGLTGNYYSTPDDWTFEVSFNRAKSYYDLRILNEGYSGSNDNQRADSIVRTYFYQYAQSKLFNEGYYHEFADGSVDMNLPELPSNSPEIRATPLWTSYLFPYTMQGQAMVIHAFDSCKGIGLKAVSYTTMAAYAASGNRAVCSLCGFSTISMGNVSAASTNIDNGFEYYWAQVVEASRTYEDATNKLVEAKQELKELTEDAADLFNQALAVLAVPRPKLCPPGAYGCVAVAYRAGELTSPSQLMSSFTAEARVGAGGAVSAATLAPDNDTDANDVLVRFGEAIGSDIEGSSAGVLGNLGSLWSGLLQGYSSAYGGVSNMAQKALNKIEGIPGGSAASWLCNKVGDLVSAAGFEPADLRLRKPVLTNSQNVLEADGNSSGSTARQLVEALGQSRDAQTFARTLGRDLSNKFSGTMFTLAEIPIPGTSATFPITVDIGQLIGTVVS